MAASPLYVFRLGDWHRVDLPDCVDPSWTAGQRQKAAAVVWKELQRGASFQDAWSAAELAVYQELGVTWKEHGAPEHKEK